jgi:hypothetical protein
MPWRSFERGSRLRSTPRPSRIGPTMEPSLTDTPQLAFARLIAERDAYRSQRDDLANAIGAHRLYHPDHAHESDSELWEAYRYVMGHDLRP